MESIAEAQLEYSLFHCVDTEARRLVYQELQQRYIRRIALANAERDTERTERILADREKARAVAERDSQKARALRERFRADEERARADLERDRADENARALRHLRYSHLFIHLHKGLAICRRTFRRHLMTLLDRDVHAGLHQYFLFLSDRAFSKVTGRLYSRMLGGHDRICLHNS